MNAEANVNFSVLMSVYDEENPVFLESALESIYDEQTLKPDEIVIVYDGKLTEELYQVINGFKSGKESVVKTVQLNQRNGLGGALREGCRHCRGKYILRMDSDDISESDRFEKQLAFAAAHPELDVIGGSIAEFKTNSDACCRIRSCPETHDGIAKMSRTRNPMNHVTVCIKKSSLDKCGGYESLEQLEDYYLWLKMLNSGCTFGNMPDILVKVRVGSGFAKRRGSKKLIIGWLRLQRYMLDNHMINIAKAAVNMLCIVGFTLIPAPLRSFVYNSFLRRKI